MDKIRKNRTALISIIGTAVLAIILVFTTVWMGRSARRDTESAVRTVSNLYLDELAGRREQVVEHNLSEKAQTFATAIALMTEQDLSDREHMMAYQSRMKRLLRLERFAFVDEDGLIYTSVGYETNIDEYDFDYRTLKEPQVFSYHLEDSDASVIIAIPTDISFQGKKLTAGIVGTDMEEMLEGTSMTTNTSEVTFCNIYTRDGTALTKAILGGLAQEDNLLDAMKRAVFESPYTYASFAEEFESGTRGQASFTYNGIRETLAYIPITGTDWQLTYLIRESVISERISHISEGAVTRGIIQSVLTVAVMLGMFAFIMDQVRKSGKLQVEKERADTENRIKQEELTRRLELNEKLLREERARKQQENLIAALSSDYWSVYYLNLDKDQGICYQEHEDLDGTGFKVGESFEYLKSVTDYANTYVTDAYRDAFLKFVQPENVKKELETNRVTAYTYLVKRHDHESYETVRFADTRHPEERDGSPVTYVGACFADTDEETRKNAAQNQALSDALRTAEEASKAKTAFLSNMSHEIRTPMNAIIGLDTIALNDPETPEKTKEYLRKIGRSAEHLLGLINDILDMTRIESGRMVLRNEEFSFSKLLETVNTMFSAQCHDKGIDYQCHVIGDIGDYYIGDNMKLRQVLINILGNAVKFTPEGGVQFEVERIAQFDGKSSIQFRITDTGIGMSEDFLPKIFEPFSQEDNSTTGRYGSSGLGLAITRSIVEMMNGHIEAASTKGKGSVFTVTVTLDDAKREEETAKGDIEIEPARLTVLIVDDDAVACEHAKLVLEKIGISSELADSGAKAVEMVTLRHARHEPYNLILVDWKMPEMDGLETTRRIREVIGDESAIIILTAYRWDDVFEEATKAGVDSFIPKPLFASAVLEEFRSALQKKNVLARQTAGAADLAGRRVLLAEDVEVNAEIMEMVLQMRDIRSEIAANGKIAVEKFSASAPGYYDAVLMDVRMPEMDGLEATRTIRAMDREDAKHIPIIALTANAFDEDVQRSLQAGMNAHLSKPVQPEVLFETLESLIHD